MRFIHIADLHFSNTYTHSRVLPDKNITDRLHALCTLFEFICSYAVKNGIKLILISGDVYHIYSPSSRGHF